MTRQLAQITRTTTAEVCAAARLVRPSSDNLPDARGQQQSMFYPPPTRTEGLRKGQSMRAHWGPRHMGATSGHAAKGGAAARRSVPAASHSTVYATAGPASRVPQGRPGAQAHAAASQPATAHSVLRAPSPCYHEQSTHAHANIHVPSARCTPREGATPRRPPPALQTLRSCPHKYMCLIPQADTGRKPDCGDSSVSNGSTHKRSMYQPAPPSVSHVPRSCMLCHTTVCAPRRRLTDTLSTAKLAFLARTQAHPPLRVARRFLFGTHHHPLSSTETRTVRVHQL